MKHFVLFIVVLLVAGCTGNGQKTKGDRSFDAADREIIMDRNGKTVELSDTILKEITGEAGVDIGKSITLSIDYELQQLGQALMEGKRGAVVALEPSTGEVLCMVSSSNDSLDSKHNRCVSASYTSGSVFKAAQALVLMSEGIISPETLYSCERGFGHHELRVGCHAHVSPLALSEALSQACNGYFCQGFLSMMSDKRYGDVQGAMTMWKDYMSSLGFGYKLGIDLQLENRGFIPNADYYDGVFHHQWDGLSIVNIAIGQGEVTATPLQLGNLSAIIANRGHYFVPHVVKEIQGAKIDSIYTTLRQTKVSRDACDAVIKGMRMSAIRGTCRSLSTLPFETCGISGTAISRGYDHSVFIGFAPVDQPKIAVAVYVENGGWGAKYGVPIGGLVMEWFLNGTLSEASKSKAKQIQSQHISYETEDSNQV